MRILLLCTMFFNMEQWRYFMKMNKNLLFLMHVRIPVIHIVKFAVLCVNVFSRLAKHLLIVQFYKSISSSRLWLSVNKEIYIRSVIKVFSFVKFLENISKSSVHSSSNTELSNSKRVYSITETHYVALLQINDQKIVINCISS